ncbi:MAG: OadG family protein [Cyclobacteriaceae bacterium]|nr:OadG family protein [Cyclobacteriaceae bacterium]
MTESLQTALTLLVLGMVTVFAILMLVVSGGRFIIYLSNKYFPGQGKGTPPEDRLKKNKHLAVIAAITEYITAGKGSVERIEKIK